MKIKKSQLRQIIKEELTRFLNEVAVPDLGEELDAAQRMADEEVGPKKVKALKDFDDVVYTGPASIVDVIGIENLEEAYAVDEVDEDLSATCSECGSYMEAVEEETDEGTMKRSLKCSECGMVS